MAITSINDKSKIDVKGRAEKPSFFQHDFSIVRWPAVTFLICAVIGVIFVSSTQILLENQEKAVNVAQTKAVEIQEKLRQAEIDKNQIDTYQADYLQLVAKGFVGTERRLGWIETVQAIQKNNAMLPITYNINEQKKFQVDPSIDTGVFELRGSKITVNMDIFHEGDLTTFFTGLKQTQFYDLQSCSIKRLSEASTGHVSPLLHAECSLYLITIDKREPENSVDANPTQANS